jgi:DNA-binding HxlR family transcriptional regulator
MPDSRFIERKGALEVLFEVSSGKKRFTDIQQNIEISSATISNRLKEGKVEGVWEEQLEQSEDGSARRVYVITPQGQEVVDRAEELSLPKIIDELQEIETEYEQRIEELGDRQQQIV